jgi:hypothetical protein
MTTNNLKRAEILFWDFIIHTLSESRILRFLIPRIYNLIRSMSTPEAGIALLITAVGGFICGVIIKMVLILLV